MERAFGIAFLLMTGCSDATPRLDASTKATLQASLEAMTRASPASEKRAAEEAVTTIVQRELERASDPGLAILALHGLTLPELLAKGRSGRR